MDSLIKQFRQSSQLSGGNAGYIEDLYEHFKKRQLDASRATMAGTDATQNGVRFREDLYEPFYGGRQFSIADPNGFELVFMSDEQR